MKIISRCVSDTFKIGKAIARNLQKGDILCLFGGLGSGKTVLTKGIAAGLGIKRSVIVSPTFVLIRQYRGGKLPLYHFDLYRLKTAGDILALGYQEYLYDDAVTVIEWADRLSYLSPKEYLKVELLIKPHAQRLFKFNAFGKYYKGLLRQIQKDLSV